MDLWISIWTALNDNQLRHRIHTNYNTDSIIFCPSSCLYAKSTETQNDFQLDKNQIAFQLLFDTTTWTWSLTVLDFFGFRWKHIRKPDKDKLVWANFNCDFVVLHNWSVLLHSFSSRSEFDSWNNKFDKKK